MSRFLLTLVVAGVAGIAGAWGINYYRYGHRQAYLGEMEYQGSVTAANLPARMAELAQTDNPKVELPGGSEFDFGAMPPESKDSHSFVIKNVGKGDLKLRLGATTCKCTLGTLANDVLKPGEQTEVKLEWTVKTTEKTFGQSAQVLTNDPLQYAIDLKVNGRVVREMEMVPEAVTLGEVASGEAITAAVKVYSYMRPEIEDFALTFSSDELNEFSDVTIEPFKPSEADGVNSGAVQGFDVSIKFRPGLKQGPISQNMIFSFRHDSELPNEGDSKVASSDDDQRSFTAAITGKIVGKISMIPNARLSGSEGGNYIYDFGELGSNDKLTAKTFVVLKGSDRDNANLRIKSVTPENVVKATLGEPRDRGSSTLYPLDIELIPGAEPIEMLGRDKADYGKITIQSDIDGGDSLVIGLKFLLDAR